MADAVQSKTLQITIVTPEKAVLDESADLVVLPMFDGELGVLAGRAPFVGQLGPGELRIKSGSKTKRIFVDGGFVQVRSNTVNVLTPSARKPEELTDALLALEQTKVDALPSTSATEIELKKRATLKLKGMNKVRPKN